jgi:hypothetical protein
VIHPLATILASLVGISHAAPAPAQENRPARIYLLGGQSNMDGRAALKALPAELKITPANVEYWSRTPDNKTVARARFEDYTRAFGIEVTLAHELAKAYPNDRIVIAKFAIGGTSMAMWTPAFVDDKGVSREGKGYPSLVACGKKIQAEYPGARLCAFLWLQGESDGGNEHMAKNYGAHLAALVQGLRKDLGAPNLPCLYGRVSVKETDKLHGAFTRLVREGQESVQKTVPHARMISTDEINPNRDVHYPPEGVLQLGRLFAAACREMDREEGRPAK